MSLELTLLLQIEIKGNLFLLNLKMQKKLAFSSSNQGILIQQILAMNMRERINLKSILVIAKLAILACSLLEGIGIFGSLA
jgi:hypothetical protein